MKRRSKSGDRPGKTHRGGRAASKRRQPPTAARRRPASRRNPAGSTDRPGEVERLARELDQAAEQQRATAEVLRLIGGSSGDLQPVFATILESAVRLGEADHGVINRWDGEVLHLIAIHNMPEAYVELRRQSPYRPNQHSASGRMLALKRPVHVVDLARDQAYLEGNPATVAAVEAGVRTTLAVPMWKDHELIGSFTVGRKQVRPFTKKQIEIVQTFADHAVIAVENARLLHELRETLQQQTATADVLKIISRSAFDLQTVLDTLLEMAVRLCGADLAALHPKPGKFSAIATYGGPETHRELARTVSFEPDRGSVIGRTALESKPVQVADVLADPDYTLHDAQKELGYRTVLGVPLLREGEPIGIILLMRFTVRPFNEKQIELVQNFADQAVIAIENMRLLTELRRRTDELGRSVTELRRERNNKLMNMEAMAAAISHEVRQPLASIAANGSAALRFLGHAPPDLDEVRAALNRAIGDSHRASQVFDNIRALFGKADRDFEPLGINELVHTVLDSLQGELEEHRIASEVALAPNLPPVMGHRGQLQEVLVNLLRNAIEAIGALDDERRLVKVSTERRGGSRIAVTVEDSGPGIDPKQLKNIFDPFVTTKTHGMGLGLALCRMIIERHGGELLALPAQPRGSIFQAILSIARHGATEASQ